VNVAENQEKKGLFFQLIQNECVVVSGIIVKTMFCKRGTNKAWNVSCVGEIHFAIGVNHAVDIG
jgi:hypothetical protein